MTQASGALDVAGREGGVEPALARIVTGDLAKIVATLEANQQTLADRFSDFQAATGAQIASLVVALDTAIKALDGNADISEVRLAAARRIWEQYEYERPNQGIPARG